MFYIVCYFDDQCVLLEKEEELILNHGQADVGDTVAKAFKTRTLDDSGFERLVDVTYSAVVLFRSQERSRASAFKTKLQRYMANTKAEGEKFFSAMVDFGKAQFLLEAKTKRGASAGVQKVLDELVTSQTSEPVRKTAVGKEDNRKKRQLSCSEEVLEPSTSRKGSKPAKVQTSKKQRKVEVMKKKLDSVARNMEVDALEEDLMSGAFWLGEQSETASFHAPASAHLDSLTPAPVPSTSNMHASRPPSHTHAPGSSTSHTHVPGPSSSHTHAPGPSTSHTHASGPSSSHMHVPGPSSSHTHAPGPSTSHTHAPNPSTSHMHAPGPSTSHTHAPGPSTSHMHAPNPSTSHMHAPGPSTSHMHTPGPSTSHTPVSYTQLLAPPCSPEPFQSPDSICSSVFSSPHATSSSFSNTDHSHNEFLSPPHTFNTPSNTSGFYRSVLLESSLDCERNSSCCRHCNSMRFEIQYLHQALNSLEREIKELKNSRNTEQSDDNNTTRQEKNRTQNYTQTLFNGFLEEQLECLAMRKKSPGLATGLLFRKMFSPEEVVGRSASGTRGKPAIDQAKKEALVRIILKCFPGRCTEADIHRRLADMLKPSRFMDTTDNE